MPPSGNPQLAMIRRTKYRNQGVPGVGGVVSGGGGRCFVHRSRAAKAIPPHSPFEAFPIPIGPSLTAGAEGNEFGKWNPWAEGRNPGTRTIPTTAAPFPNATPSRIMHHDL